MADATWNELTHAHFEAEASGKPICEAVGEPEVNDVVDAEAYRGSEDRWSGTITTKRCACGATNTLPTVVSGTCLGKSGEWSGWHHKMWPHVEFRRRASV